MTINEVPRHAVTEQRIEQALDDMFSRAFDQWHDMVWNPIPLRSGLRELGEELADHLGARTVSDWRSAQQLDAAGTLTPDQRLLRVLLDDDQAAFEQALHDRLVAHHESVGADPAAKSLLTVGAATLAALAHTAHGWELSVRSAYLPEALVRTPAQ